LHARWGGASRWKRRRGRISHHGGSIQALFNKVKENGQKK